MQNKQSFYLWGQLRDFIIDNKDKFPDNEKQELEKIMQIVNYNFDSSRRKLIKESINEKGKSIS